MTPDDLRSPLGLQAFDALRAEEEPWLEAAFVPPADFPLLIGGRSIALFGDDGGGKSAVLKMVQRAVATGTASRYLIVEWRPQFDQVNHSDRDVTWTQEILQMCAMALVGQFAQQPQAWEGLNAWDKTFLQQFLQQYRIPFWEIEIARLESRLDAQGRSWLRDLRVPAANMGIVPDLTTRSRARLLHYFVETIQTAGWEGIWVLGDGFERWQQQDDSDRLDRLDQDLRGLFSTLALFDQPGFAFKLAFPTLWRDAVRSLPAIRTRRIDECPLVWDEEDLMQVVGKRLAVALDRPNFSLEHLCPDCDLRAWLTWYGGLNPRRWLVWSRALFSAYQQRGYRPLTIENWRQISRRLAPYLHLHADGEVHVGPNRVDLPPRLHNVLAYLYGERRVCSREELYFIAYKGLPRVPRKDEHGWEGPASWRGVIDTVLWRLRQAIEPNPRRPAFIKTVRGQGVVLERVEHKDDARR